MEKSDILNLINGCIKKIEDALKKENLSEEQKEKLNKLLQSTQYHAVHVNMNVANGDKETLAKYEKHFKELDKKLDAIILSQAEPKKDKKGKKQKVKEVIPEEKQKESTKKKRTWLKWVLIICGTFIILLLILANCIKDNLDPNDDFDLDLDTNPGWEQTNPTYDPNKDNVLYIKPIDRIDLDNQEQMVAYAKEIQKSLGLTTLSKDDIIYAIRLANLEKLDNKAHFEDRDGVYYSTKVIGEITSKLGSDSIVRKDTTQDTYLTEAQLKDILLCATDGQLNIHHFSSAKVGIKYDIYNVADLCIQGLNAKNKYSVYYAKVFNDLMAREAMAFTVAPNSPISTRFILAGMYNANSKRILKLTSGNGLTSVYGDGTRIDGYYGFICVEELEAYMQIGNENNILYTDVIDQNITTYANGITR